MNYKYLLIFIASNVIASLTLCSSQAKQSIIEVMRLLHSRQAGRKVRNDK